MKYFALGLFILMYILMIALPKKRLWFVLGSALIFIVSGIVPAKEAVFAINWNVLMMIAGTMVVVYYFIESAMPDLIADMLLDKAKNVAWVTIYMSLFAGLVSAFIDNVATVLMIAPVALAICRKMKISPVPMIISISVSSNLQGAATLVGDTTSILLGDYAKMDFIDFFFMHGRPGIFFAVELGALATVPVMLYIFRKDKQKVFAEKRTDVKSYAPTVFLIGIVVTLIFASFIPGKPDATNGLICMAFATISMVWDLIMTGKLVNAKEAAKNLDLETILLLTGLFIAIEGITRAGVIDDAASLIVNAGGNNIFLLYTIVVWGSVVISAFVDNIPYVATMLPVLAGVTKMLGIEPYLLYFGLLTGATLGGNLTPIGASANITAVGMLRREGCEVSFGDFFRIGGTFTLTAVLVGYLYLWIVWR
ncbi:MAG: arsenic transporter [Lachnospiraceae bacterium]|nr:arsenic transporter [Lachnospiraceae bacterium]